VKPLFLKKKRVKVISGRLVVGCGLPRRLEIIVPDLLYERLEKASRKARVKIEDILMRTLVRVIEEFE